MTIGLVKSSVLTISILIVVVVVAGCSPPVTSDEKPPATKAVTFNEGKVMVFQSPACKCCESYKSYLTEQGFQVETVHTEDMSSVRNYYQIPQDMGSCHTAVIEDYFVEGHVPVEAIKRLLEENPDIDGITLAGMPSGAPGMSSQKTEAFRIYALLDGTASEFMVVGE